MLGHCLPAGWMLVEREQRCWAGRQMPGVVWGRVRSLAAPTAMFGAGKLPQACARAEEGGCVGPQS